MPRSSSRELLNYGTHFTNWYFQTFIPNILANGLCIQTGRFCPLYPISVNSVPIDERLNCIYKFQHKSCLTFKQRKRLSNTSTEVSCTCFGGRNRWVQPGNRPYTERSAGQQVLTSQNIRSASASHQLLDGRSQGIAPERSWWSFYTDPIFTVIL